MFMESLLIWQSQQMYKKSFIKAIRPVFSALFMKKLKKNLKVVK